MINGTDRILYIKQGTTYLPIGCLTSNSLTENVDMLDSTTTENTDGWGTSRPTKQNYSISFSGLVTNENTSLTTVTLSKIKELKRARTKIDWKIADGVLKFEYGSGYITEISNSANIDEFISFDGTITGFGKILVEI